MRFVESFIVFLVITGAALAENSPATIDLKAEVTPDEAPLGEVLQISVTLVNRTDETILMLVRDANFVVEVEGPTGTTFVDSPRYIRKVVPFVDDEVPLLPGAAYRRSLSIPLNDLHATLAEGWLGVPGTYSLRLAYDSARSSRDHSKSIWHGALRSNVTRIQIHPPTPDEQRRRLEQLRQCVGGDECDTTVLANFYRIVRDNTAAELLLRLLETTPYSIWLLDAIVAQGRVPDATRVREIASRVTDPAIQSAFSNAAALLDENRPTSPIPRERRPKP